MSKPHTNPVLPADRLHLLPRHREMLVALLREHLPGIEAWAYGSRVNGQSHDGSDLDLVLRSPDLQKIPIGQVADFREALRESNIPFLVEAHDWARLPKGFHPEIERGYVVLIEKEKRDAASEWPMIRFSDAVQINPPVRLERGKAYPFVDMATVNASSRSAYALERRVYSGGGTRFRSGDTLMARITPCLENGKIARYCDPDPTDPAHGSTEFIVIRGRPDVTDHEFAYYLTQWEEVRHYAIGQMTGTSGRQRVPTKALDHLVVTIPPLPEQRAIAHILGALDDKIELNRRMNETLESMARALFQSWFVDFDPVQAKAALKRHAADPIPPRGNSTPATKAAPSDHSSLEGESTRQGRRPAVEPVGENQTPLPLPKGGDWTAERARAYLDRMEPEIAALFPDSFAASESGRMMPEGWEEMTLSTVALLNPEAWTARNAPETIVYVDLSNTKWGTIEKYETHEWQDAPSRAKRVLRTGDTILGTVRPGNGSYAFIGRDGLTGSTGFAVLRPILPRDRALVWGYATAPENIRRLAHVADGTAYPAVRPQVVSATEITLPSGKIRDAFGRVCGPFLDRIEANQRESCTLAALRDTLLPELVSGRIRIPGAELQETSGRGAGRQ